MLRELLFLQAARPDRLLAHLHGFIEHVLGKGFASSSSEASLTDTVKTQIKANVPVLLCGVKGFDTSFKVDDCAATAGKNMVSIAVGSQEVRVCFFVCFVCFGLFVVCVFFLVCLSFSFHFSALAACAH